MDEIWREPVRGGYADVSFLGMDGMQRMRASLEGMSWPPPPIHHLNKRPRCPPDHPVDKIPAIAD